MDDVTDIHLLYEDEHLLAIHKPHDVPFHGDDSGKGIVQLVREFYGAESLFPVHRLDRMTSGLMLLAKTPRSNSALSQLFEAKKIEKYYLAVAEKRPPKKQGLIAGDMVKSRRGSYKLTRESHNPAITRFYARAFEVSSESYWGFILKPETGKTHQLRVALKSLGSPILGDIRYGGKPADRGYLHAYSIRFSMQGNDYVIKDEKLESSRFSFQDMSNEIDAIDEPEKVNWGKRAFRASGEY